MRSDASCLAARRLPPVHGFTLIELMVALAIGALLMLTAIPAVRALQKPPLVRAVNDFTEACRRARAQAILTGRAMQVVIHNGGSSIGIEPAPVVDPTAKAFAQAGAAMLADPSAGGTGAPGAAAKGSFSATLPDGVAFQKLTVNLRDQMQEQAVAIKFYPNGTCDQLDAELTWERTKVQGLTLEVMTGQLSVVSLQ